MELSPLQRWGFFTLGVLAATIGGWAYSRSEMTVTGLFAFLPGLILVAGAFFGTAPNLTFKDTKVEWPKDGEPKSVEPGEDEAAKAIEQLRLELAQTNKRLAEIDERLAEGEEVRTDQGENIEELRGALKYVSDRLDSYILANSPPPDDGLTDEARLEEWSEGYRDLDHEVNSRRYHGMDHYAGPGAEDLRKARADLENEERRQRAQFNFGMRDKPPRSIDY